MPNRVLREGILDSDAVNSLSWPGEVFYRRLMSVVDDYGRFDARPAVLRSRLYPLKLAAVSESDVSSWLAECQRAGLVRLYSEPESGKQYLLFQKFNQHVRAKVSKFPDPPPGPEPDALHMQCTRSADAVHVRSESESESKTKTEAESKADDDPRPPPEFGVVSPPKAEIFVETWNAAGLMKITPTPKVRQLWQQRWADDPDFRARWREAIQRASGSQKCRGQDPKDPWKLHPHWFLEKPDVLVRILDWGEYDDRRPAKASRVDDAFAQAKRLLAQGQEGG